MLFRERIFNEMISTKCFQKNVFHEMYGKHDGGKVRKPGLLIIYVGRIARQQLLDISADYLTNNRGVYIVIELSKILL